MEYQYEGDRIIGETVTVEPEFDEEQVSLLLAHRELESDIGPHGVPMSVAMDPDTNPSVWGGPKIEIGIRTDWVAKKIADSQDAYKKRYPDANTNGQLWSARIVDD